ncbi:Hypothetical predicted protein [Xyrichtys novacula]|uniref:Uncharacterized protein n=1 Tax=Xyrichtys novacula TaxID=13765 RepID=A0AAV1EMR9_XYRNO|nr:Hypothetical predicted protein [Xyrichtys novacula]
MNNNHKPVKPVKVQDCAAQTFVYLLNKLEPSGLAPDSFHHRQIYGHRHARLRRQLASVKANNFSSAQLGAESPPERGALWTVNLLVLPVSLTVQYFITLPPEHELRLKPELCSAVADVPLNEDSSRGVDHVGSHLQDQNYRELRIRRESQRIINPAIITALASITEPFVCQSLN